MFNPASFSHVPVLCSEMLAALAPRDNALYVDGTFGGGGYTRALLNAADCRVFAIDRDSKAIQAGQELMHSYKGRLILQQGCFSAMDTLLSLYDIRSVDGVVLDIGVSSMQLDEAERGFSFLKDGPLDMRMSQTGVSAADIVNSYSAEQLQMIISRFGEERRARTISQAICTARLIEPILTTGRLALVIEKAVGRFSAGKRLHPATRSFQALRIYVNAELEELTQALHAAEILLGQDGRLAVVSFHSLEDRIVKQFLKERTIQKPAISRHMPETNEHLPPSFSLIFKGHREADDAELRTNPRARSAKMRAAIRTSASAFPFAHKSVDLSKLPLKSHRKKRGLHA